MEALPLLHINLLMKCCNLWLLFLVSVTCFSSYSRACPPVKCGGGHEFWYPLGRRNSGCGDPLLQLQCDNHSNMPLLDTNGSQYYILDYLPYCNSLALEGIVMIITDKNQLEKECDPSSSNSMQCWSDTLLEGCEDAFQNKASKLGCNASFSYNTSSEMNSTGKCKSEVHLSVKNPLDPNKREIFELKIKRMPSSSYRPFMSDKGVCAYEANITSKPSFCKPRDNVPHLPCKDSNYGDKPNNNGIHQDNVPHHPCDDSNSGDKPNNNCIHQGKKSKVGAIIGGSVGGVVGLILLFIGCAYLRQKKKKKSHPLPDGSNLITKDVENNYSIDIEAGVQARIGNLPIFSYEVLKKATDDFDDNNMLGDGGFGTVYLGKLPDGRTVAVKRMYQDNYRKLDQFINEIEILSSLHHPYLVRLYGCTSQDSRDLLLVYEYVPNGTVADHIHGERKGKGLSWDIRLKISLETAQALAFLHSQEPPILHRDVKTTNILLDENFKVKVADFGLSRCMPPHVTHVSTAPQGTPGYVDPEYYQCFQLTEKSDVYSFGVVLIEIISGKLAVDINRSRNEIALANMAITKIKDGTLHELVDAGLGYDSDDKIKAAVTAISELAFSCLQSVKEDRPCMKEIVAQLDQIQKNWSNSGKDKVFNGMAPLSPTSVQDWLLSTKTTPNNSG